MDSLHWPTAKPYQPQGISFQPCTIGSTGVIKLDWDGDGKYSSARDYAEILVNSRLPLTKLISELSDYDVSVSSQTAELLDQSGINLTDDALTAHLINASPQTRRGFILYMRSKFGTAR